MIVCLGTTPTLARTMEFESLVLNGVNRAVRTYEYAAGKALNAARAITTLGEHASVIGVAGGATGERLRVLSSAVAFEQEFAIVKAATRLCVTAIDRSAGTSSELIEESGVLEPSDEDRVLDSLRRRLAGAKLCVLAGSIAPGIGRDFYARCLSACRAAGVPAIVDATGEALRAAIGESPQVVKINAGELASIESLEDESDAALIAAAAALARRTSGWVIITRGELSTIATHPSQGTIVASVPTVRVISPIGSGDSFAGGLAVGMSRGLPMVDAIRLATACASANAMTADAAHFDEAIVEQLRHQVAAESK